MSAYVIKAVLSNTQHPEYGQATILFPIPNEEYDQTIEMLESLKMGDALRQDCQVEKLDSHYSVLNRLVGKSVSVDELDYLAKRLDSFDEGEAEQFQAMAHKLGMADIKDFINLTFCCQQATVITDFSDLEAVGRRHYMNLNGGCASSEELENLDGHETALLLIDSRAGVVTPYGVVYDNGMKLEQLYDGRHFPCYHYDAAPITAGVISCCAPRETKPVDWLYLPASQGQISRTLARAGIQKPGDVLLCDFENILPKEVEQALFPDREYVENLNGMCAAISLLDDVGRKKLEAVVKMAVPDCASQIKQLAENLDQFDFIPNVHTPEEYGEYMIRESGQFEYDEHLADFYDYRLYGEQRAEAEGGQFNEYGYVAYHGTAPLEELMLDAPAEQYQQEQGPQMGGML